MHDLDRSEQAHLSGGAVGDVLGLTTDLRREDPDAFLAEKWIGLSFTFTQHAH